MWAVSERFLEAISGSHRVATRARAIPTTVPPQFTANPTDSRLVTLPLSDGGVKLSSTADINGTGTINVPGDYWDVLQPYGVEVYLERGVDYGDGTQEYVPCGYYRVDEVAQESAPAGPLRVELVDRMAQLKDNRVLAPVQFEALTTHRQIFQRLVNGDSGGGQSTDGYGLYLHTPVPIIWTAYDPDAALITTALVCKDDAQDFLAKLVDAKGAIMRFDRLGRLEIVKRDRDPADPAIYTITGGAGGNLVRASRKVVRDGVYNVVVARGSDPAAPTGYKVAVHDDQTSPLYWSGRFGTVPRYYASPLLRTDAAAADAAATVLARYKGLPTALSLLAVPNPALDPLDVVAARLGATTSTHLLDEVTIPIVGPEPVTISTRTLNVVPTDDETGSGPGDNPIPNPPDPGNPGTQVPPATQAAQLILARMNSGQPIDLNTWMWDTAPAIVDAHNEQLYSAWSATQSGTGFGVGGTTHFAESFESGGFGNFAALQNKVSGHLEETEDWDQSNYQLRVVNAGSGHESVARFEIRDGDSTGGVDRTEVLFPGSCDTREGTVQWCEFNVRLGDPTWEDPDSWEVMWQWHHEGSTGSPPIEIGPHSDGKVKLSQDGLDSPPSPRTLWTIRPGVWEHVVIGVRFSEDEDEGWYRVVVNGVEVVPETPAQTLVDSGTYLKCGLYRDDASTSTQVIMYDHIKIGSALATGGAGGPDAKTWLADYIATHGAEPGAGTGAPIYPQTFLDGAAYPVVTGAGAAAATNVATLAALAGIANGQRAALAAGAYSGNGSIVGKQNVTIDLTGTTLNGTLEFTDCANVIVRGLTIPHDAPTDAVRFLGTSHHCALYDTRLGPATHPGAATTGAAGNYVRVGADAHDIRIEWNELRNKSRPGCGIAVDGNPSTNKVSKHVLIAHNDLHDFYPAIANGFEAIRLGLSGMSRDDSNSVIERNVFTAIKSEPEIVSVKAGKVRVTGNVLDKCAGSLVIRHGRGSVVADNYVLDGAETTASTGEKSGGIRIYDTDHEVAYNTIQGTAGAGFQAALLLDTGDAEGAATDLTAHWRIARAKVHHNALAECSTSIQVGDNYSLNPADCVVTDNLVADSGAQAITYVNVPEGSIGTVRDNVFNATPLGAGMAQDSDGIWRKQGVGSRLTLLKRTNVGPSATATDRLDGTGRSRAGGTTPPPTTPPASHPGEALKIGGVGGNHFNLGVGFSPGDDYREQSSSAVHRDFTEAELAGGLIIPDYYVLDSDGNVEMRAHLDGGRTSNNTKYPRTEYRELKENGVDRAAWSVSSSTEHYCQVEMAVTRMPPNKPQLCGLQLHNADDDVAMIRWDSKTTINARFGDTDVVGTLTSSYVLGTFVKLKLAVVGGTLHYFFGDMDEPMFSESLSGSGMYFKTGAYGQSSVFAGTDDVEDGPFIVKIKAGSLRCWHTGYADPR